MITPFNFFTEADGFFCFRTCKYITKSLPRTDDSDHIDKPDDGELDWCCYTRLFYVINQQQQKNNQNIYPELGPFYRLISLLHISQEWFINFAWKWDLYLHIQLLAKILLPSCNIGSLVGLKDALRLRWAVGSVLIHTKKKRGKFLWQKCNIQEGYAVVIMHIFLCVLPNSIVLPFLRDEMRIYIFDFDRYLCFV
jgi:hypothetical protein